MTRSLSRTVSAIHDRGETSPVELAVSLHHLGKAYAASGRYDVAEAALRRALDTAERKLTAGDPLIASARKSFEQVQKMSRSPRTQPAANPVPAAPAPQ